MKSPVVVDFCRLSFGSTFRPAAAVSNLFIYLPTKVEGKLFACIENGWFLHVQLKLVLTEAEGRGSYLKLKRKGNELFFKLSYLLRVSVAYTLQNQIVTTGS